MTSVDSGIETSNNSNDSSIAQNDDSSTGEMNNGSTGLVTITNNEIDHREIKPLNIQLPPLNQHYSFNFTPEAGNSIPTSSSRLLKVFPTTYFLFFSIER